jgi:hypothetical protein
MDSSKHLIRHYPPPEMIARESALLYLALVVQARRSFAPNLLRNTSNGNFSLNQLTNYPMSKSQQFLGRLHN